MAGRKLWVAELLISDRTAAKIRGAHKLEPDDVRDAVQCRERLVYVWDEDPDRGLRAIVQAVVRGVPTKVVLYPVENDPVDDIYHLGSAYPTRGGH